MLNTVGFRETDIIFPNDVVAHIINSYTYEAGVRKLKEKIFEPLRVYVGGPIKINSFYINRMNFFVKNELFITNINFKTIF